MGVTRQVYSIEDEVKESDEMKKTPTKSVKFTSKGWLSRPNKDKKVIKGRERRESVVDKAKRVAKTTSDIVLDYNTLESYSLQCSLFIMLSGLIFMSSEFGHSTLEYVLLENFMLFLLVASSCFFFASVANELRKAFKFGAVNRRLIELEIELKELTSVQDQTKPEFAKIRGANYVETFNPMIQQ